MSNGWKITAIIFMILFFVQSFVFGYAIYLGVQDINNERDCYYDICGYAIDAFYQDNVCYCYEYDNLGELILDKTEVMK